ncbi:MAG: hypothetical protein IM550_22650 [Microcystis sp. M54BS1]|nr:MULTISPECIES: hypothetical protein [unclassified Microcystis]MCA2505836.1 hypothetical protein [Microcystis sp. M62BS1]MCA2532829.1 hypothetical protein [Microcystis sp. M51BS1]MCA2541910.1 hypothetical protein [Microcystis sp. M54BS1]MCA2549506.1 hypothetical protein [Microcystis sp. M53BS1]MCA2568941.1 hypothetical protein [Microcystis sp. M44BS1]MCA2576186.1 hypothetical protein [Microcystis sp. M41BS1]MCA2587350.1 hypothetical protein [Microcystis sp. M34BS1]MCA2598151.1 hypothetical
MLYTRVNAPYKIGDRTSLILLHTAMNCYRFNSCVGNELAINRKLI